MNEFLCEIKYMVRFLLEALVYVLLFLALLVLPVGALLYFILWWLI